MQTLFFPKRPWNGQSKKKCKGNAISATKERYFQLLSYHNKNAGAPLIPNGEKRSICTTDTPELPVTESGSWRAGHLAIFWAACLLSELPHHTWSGQSLSYLIFKKSRDVPAALSSLQLQHISHRTTGTVGGAGQCCVIYLLQVNRNELREMDVAETRH